jgi:hypothetical protein
LQAIQVGESDSEFHGIRLKCLAVLNRAATGKFESVDGRSEQLLIGMERRRGHLLQQRQQCLYLLGLVHLPVLEYLPDGRLLEKG